MKIWLKSWIFVFNFVFFGLQAQTSQAMGGASPESEMLLGQFSNSCDLGAWTKSALSNTQQLAVVYNNLLKDKDGLCSGVSEAILNLQSVENQIRMLQQSQAALMERSAEEATNDLMLALSTAEPEARASLISSYATERANLSVAKGMLSSYDQMGRYHVERGSMALSNSLTTLINRSSNLTTCLAKYPGEAYLLATHLASLAGNFVPGLVGTGIQVLATVTQASIKTIQSMPYGRALRNLDTAQAPTAFRCAMQGMAKQYCQMKDAEKLLTLSRNYGPIDPGPTPFFAGIDLVERRLPALNQWLESIIRGIEPSNPNHASQIEVYFKRLNRGISMERSYKSYFQKAKNDFLFTNEDRVAQITILRLLVENLVQKVFLVDYSTMGQLAEDSPVRGHTYMTLAKVITAGPELDNDESFLQYISRAIPDDSNPANVFDMIQNQTIAMFIPFMKNAQDEYSRNITVSEGILVSSANEVRLDQTNAKQAIKFALNFLENYQFECNATSCDLISREQDRNIIEKMKSKLQAIYNLLDRPDATSDEVVPPNVVSPAHETISFVYENLYLSKQNIYLPKGLEDLVRKDLASRILSEQLPDDVSDLAYMAGRDLQHILSLHQSTRYNLDKDIQDAKGILYSNLENFHGFFEPALKRAVIRIAAKANQRNEPTFAQLEKTFDDWIVALQSNPKTPTPVVDTMFRFPQARLCLLLRGTRGGLPKGLDPALCRGAIDISWESRNKITWDQVISSADAHCLYEDFLREDRITEIKNRQSHLR